MNTPFSSHSWRQLQLHAAAQLSPQFADNVLRAARAEAGSNSIADRWFLNPFSVSVATAALCLAGVLFVHSRMTDAANSRHMADWQEISLQTAQFEPNP